MLILALTLISISCNEQKEYAAFELKGKFTNTKGETIYLEKLASTQPVVVDSAVIEEDGSFAFTDYKPRIGFYRIKLNQQNFAMLVLDSADKVTVTGSLSDLGNTYKVEGSEETALFIRYNDIAKARDIRLDSLNKLWQSAMETRKMDARRMDSLSALFEGPYNSIVNAANSTMASLIRKNTDKYASIMAIQSLEPDRFPEIYRALDSGLTKKYPTDRNVRMFHDLVGKMLATSIGQPAPNIILPSPAGNNIALNSLKGKVVLVDFWASWCAPCRKEMPNVVRAYERFKNKGFEIYGVSLDDNKDHWVQAIQSDGLKWPQVSDLKQFNSVAAQLYNVQAIPFTVLIDREGIIIAKNLRGPDLEEKLAEVLE